MSVLDRLPWRRRRTAWLDSFRVFDRLELRGESVIVLARSAPSELADIDLTGRRLVEALEWGDGIAGSTYIRGAIFDDGTKLLGDGRPEDGIRALIHRFEAEVDVEDGPPRRVRWRSAWSFETRAVERRLRDIGRRDAEPNRA